jgi:hypothetical protein
VRGGCGAMGVDLIDGAQPPDKGRTPPSTVSADLELRDA